MMIPTVTASPRYLSLGDSSMEKKRQMLAPAGNGSKKSHERSVDFAPGAGGYNLRVAARQVSLWATVAFVCLLASLLPRCDGIRATTPEVNQENPGGFHIGEKVSFYVQDREYHSHILEEQGTIIGFDFQNKKVHVKCSRLAINKGKTVDKSPETLWRTRLDPRNLRFSPIKMKDDVDQDEFEQGDFVRVRGSNKIWIVFTCWHVPAKDAKRIPEYLSWETPKQSVHDGMKVTEKFWEWKQTLEQEYEEMTGYEEISRNFGSQRKTEPELLPKPLEIDNNKANFVCFLQQAEKYDGLLITKSPRDLQLVLREFKTGGQVKVASSGLRGTIKEIPKGDHLVKLQPWSISVPDSWTRDIPAMQLVNLEDFDLFHHSKFGGNAKVQSLAKGPATFNFFAGWGGWTAKKCRDFCLKEPKCTAFAWRFANLGKENCRYLSTDQIQPTCTGIHDDLCIIHDDQGDQKKEQNFDENGSSKVGVVGIKRVTPHKPMLLEGNMNRFLNRNVDPRSVANELWNTWDFQSREAVLKNVGMTPYDSDILLVATDEELQMRGGILSFLEYAAKEAGAINFPSKRLQAGIIATTTDMYELDPKYRDEKYHVWNKYPTNCHNRDDWDTITASDALRHNRDYSVNTLITNKVLIKCKTKDTYEVNTENPKLPSELEKHIGKHLNRDEWETITVLKKQEGPSDLRNTRVGMWIEKDVLIKSKAGTADSSFSSSQLIDGLEEETQDPEEDEIEDEQMNIETLQPQTAVELPGFTVEDVDAGTSGRAQFTSPRTKGKKVSFHLDTSSELPLRNGEIVMFKDEDAANRAKGDNGEYEVEAVKGSEVKITPFRRISTLPDVADRWLPMSDFKRVS